MSEESKRQNDGPLPPRSEAPERAKRTGQHGENAGAQPAEYADDMLVNRFTPPPPPPEEDDDEDR